MTRTNPNSHAQPSLNDLMVRFLASRSDAGPGAVEAEGEVEPHEVAAGFRVDPRAAWTDATALSGAATPLPSEWAALVAQPAAAFAVACAAGNFPQRVKDLQPLLTTFDPAGLRPTGTQLPSPGLSGLRTWVIRETKKHQPVSALLAAGVARASRCARASCGRPGRTSGRRSCGTAASRRRPSRRGTPWPRPRPCCSTAAWPCCSSAG